MKVDKWSTGSHLFSFGWLAAWVVLGTYVLLVHHLITGLIYLGLWVAQYASRNRKFEATGLGNCARGKWARFGEN